MTSPSERYRKLEPLRSPYERRAEKCAALSLPYLFPMQGDTESNDFPTPFQSNAANGVNSMASAMTLAMLPPNLPFFRNELAPEAQTEISEIQQSFVDTGDPRRPLTEVEQQLANWERSVMKYIERGTYRTGVYQAVRYLLVVGNCLVEHLDSGGFRIHRLRSYVVERNPDDSLACIVIREEKRREQIEDKILIEMAGANGPYSYRKDDDEKIPIYTEIAFEDGGYRVTQQIGDLVLDREGEIEEGKIEDCQFWPLRFIRVDGEHYGRSHVEEYFGDIASLDVTQQAIVEAGAMASKVLWLCRPGGTTSPKALSTAPNGAFRAGDPEDVKALRLDKNADMDVTFQIWERLQSQINRAFAVPDIRQAERVTAEEIRFLQSLLERNLGGSFPLLALDLQLPMARQVTKRLRKSGALPSLPAGVVEPVIVTGIQALGRSTDSDKLDRFAVETQAAVGPAAFAEVVDLTEFVTRKAVAEGIEPDGLIRSQEELARARQAAMQQQMQMQAAMEATKAGGKAFTKAVPEGALAGAGGPAAAAA